MKPGGWRENLHSPLFAADIRACGGIEWEQIAKWEELSMVENVPFSNVTQVLRRMPQAMAKVRGSSEYPSVAGFVDFYQMPDGVLVKARVAGLPVTPTGFFGFHIHSVGRCSGRAGDPFGDASGHYNPGGNLHPRHAGDLPPLLADRGRAFQVFFTDRFSVYEILGKALIIHLGPDDFTSQPAGNAGARIACGEIRPLARGM